MIIPALCLWTCLLREYLNLMDDYINMMFWFIMLPDDQSIFQYDSLSRVFGLPTVPSARFKPRD